MKLTEGKFSRVALQPRRLRALSAADPIDADLASSFRQRYSALEDLSVIVDGDGLPLAGPNLFIASRAINSRGATGDTTRTYAECLLHWLGYLDALSVPFDSAEEQTFKSYRAELMHAKAVKGKPKYSSATVNLRTTVVVQFYLWCQLNGYPSALSEYLRQLKQERARSLAPRVIKRHPRMLSDDEIARLLNLRRQPISACISVGTGNGDSSL